MDIMEIISEYGVPIIMAICFCIGYIIKNLVPSDKINRFIPLIMGILGVILNIWMNLDFTPVILLGGLASGLASTGAHQLVNNLKKDKS